MRKNILWIAVGIAVFLLAAAYIQFGLPADISVHKLPPAQTISPTTQSTAIQVHNPPVNHIAIISMENKTYSDIVGNPDAPYINSLIKSYSFADNYFAVAHPSLPNYLAIIGGSTFGITSDCTGCTVDAQNLADQLDNVHLSWKAYMESMPSVCFLGSTSQYAQKHNPFIYFDDLRTDTQRCSNIVPYTQLSIDLKSEAATPNFIWISPNLCNDMHDCSVATGDRWLSKQVPKILNSPAFMKHNGVLVITWDESENSESNHVPAIFAGTIVKQGFVSHTYYSHYSLLHTIEDNWGLAPLTQNASQAQIITDIFKK